MSFCLRVIVNKIPLNLEKTTSSVLSVLSLIYGGSFKVPVNRITYDPQCQILVWIYINYIPDIFFIFALIKVQGYPTKHDSSKTNLRSSLILDKNLPLFYPPNFRSKILEINIKKYPLSRHFQNVVCLFCAFIISRDVKNFVQI